MTFNKGQTIFITLWYIRKGEYCAGIAQRVETSRFIIDGRHHRFANIEGIATRSSYYSYKFKNTALTNLFIIDRNGICRYVSKSYPASAADITVYRTNIGAISQKLRLLLLNSGVNDSELIIQGDLGFECSRQELVTCTADGSSEHRIFNKYRILVEQYFGRMASKFASARLPFRLAEDKHDNYINAITFLTNCSVTLNPLRAGEENGHKKYLLDLVQEKKAKNEKNNFRVKKSRSRKLTKRSYNVDMPKKAQQKVQQKILPPNNQLFLKLSEVFKELTLHQLLQLKMNLKNKK